ncbi:outer membrane protein [Taklimakanibacter lacteus]|uniref:outer membrane protein n=1 Tax=Taklimakanibacter lacteus TaxID=2268456 RepID=UPI000E66B843
MKFSRISLITLAFAATTALTGAATAADVTEQPYVHDWTGFYIGGHVGYGWINLNGKYTGEDGEDFIDDEGGTFDLDDDDILGGAQLGYNYQMGDIVVGIEADVSFVSWEDELINGTPELVSFDTDYLASVRARAGLAFDNVLVYLTAGAAWTDTNYYVNDHVDDTDPSEFGDIDLDDFGGVVGGGVAYAFDEHWSIRAEALYYIFDDKEDASGLTHDSEETDFVELDDIFVARVGIDFHF